MTKKGLGLSELLEEPQDPKLEVVQELGKVEAFECCYRDISGDIRDNVSDVQRNSIMFVVNNISENIFDIKKRFCALGGALIEAKPFVKDVWSFKKGRWCKNIYEFAEHCFNLCATTTKNLISIAQKFGIHNTLRPEYEKYEYGQLCEMLPLVEEQLKLVHPGMTVQEIRALKKVQKQTGQISDQNSTALENSGIEAVLSLKNDAERLDFLKQYKYWTQCAELPEFGLKFYKIELNNGDVLVATENTYFLSKQDKNYDYYVKYLSSVVYRLIRKGTESTHYGYSTYAINDNEYLRYLKNTKAKFKTGIVFKNYEEYKKKVEEMKNEQ